MKAIVDSLSDVPASFHDEYEARDGKYILKLEGDPPGFVRANDYGEMRQKVDRFRDGYTGVMKRAKEIAGVDEMDDDLAPLQRTVEALKAKLSEASADPNSQSLQDQIQKAIKPLQEKLDRSESERAAALARANKSLLREDIGSVLIKAGAHPNALSFLLDQSEKVFEVRDEIVSARDGHLYEGKPVTPDVWVTGAMKDYDFAFGRSSGGGATPRNGEPTQGSGVKTLRNPTPQQLGQYMDDIAAGKMQIVND